jgi:hypothetical protein
MRESNILGWFAVNALTSALLFLVLVFFDPLGVLGRKQGALLLVDAWAA